MKLSRQAVIELLEKHDLLVEAPKVDLTFDHVHYDTRQVKPHTLFVVKGAFKAEYLDGVGGVDALVTEQRLAGPMPQFLVKDSQKALSILAMAYFDYPQEKLWIGAFTGTKGKTTAAYFAYTMLQEDTDGKTALFSTVDRIVGPKAEDKKKSDLTTPESYELFKDMRRAVDNGMTHLVMEVSSQAYLRNRVYGLRFNVGAFLNISPDHIGPNEHPTFADYLAHKEMLLDNSDHVILNSGMDHFDEIYQRAAAHHDRVLTYGRTDRDYPALVRFTSEKSALHESHFTVTPGQAVPDLMETAGTYRLNLPGDFNEENAVAALMMVGLAGAKHPAMVAGLDEVTIPGRMLSLTLAGHGVAFVDYAHNYVSLLSLLAFAKAQSPDGQVIVVLGAPGNKGVSRRADFAKVLSAKADQVFLTADDPQYEDPRVIAETIADGITNDHVQVHFEMDRITAIHQAINAAGPNDLVVVAGKGEDPYQKLNGVDTPYIGDYAAVKECQAALAAGQNLVTGA
ncbi:UDP-N-acetylmuramyl tripeptide synthase [Fructobacillus pseudoficulneus]|uniref:UDP-N-acetylmuramyl tripeptide synthase n=1 Tax=Fructobacillus pseudoficulneus TaxID=220714 RepID=A0A3F3GR51_9LACO|nr:UDP-N-acetylmuramyl-tripeptide synthetase [Fructobacillus pseudoficulneus]GAP02221.1 UDP-N-acetylmuramyl tripeptide synthase [Fructobacillus pseudoficulneus]SEH36106.1 UDP-N-acetylmuramoylalanyl-D-glutamate--2,6-diaminopimelate ligase [Fructobacillus pseudoficulneus]